MLQVDLSFALAVLTALDFILAQLEIICVNVNMIVSVSLLGASSMAHGWLWSLGLLHKVYFL
jgi:hypothetical protein